MYRRECSHVSHAVGKVRKVGKGDVRKVKVGEVCGLH